MCLVKNLAALPSISSDLSGKKVVVTVTNKQLYTIVTGTERYPRKVMSMRRMGQKKLAHSNNSHVSCQKSCRFAEY
jgi:hypothetical protein